MPIYSRVILFVETILVLAMVIFDPHQAHRPPNFRALLEGTIVETTVG
jgi:hypothetical protein